VLFYWLLKRGLHSNAGYLENGAARVTANTKSYMRAIPVKVYTVTVTSNLLRRFICVARN